MTTQAITNPDGSMAVIVTTDPAYSWKPAPPPPPVPPKPTMLVGTDLNPLNRKVFPGSAFSRFYNVPGAGFKPPTVPAGTMPFPSFKDDPATPAVTEALKAWRSAQTAPPTGWKYSALIGYHHEDEGDESIQLYQDRTGTLASLVEEYGGGHVGQCQCFTGYEEIHLNKGIRAEDMYVPGDHMVVGLDCYEEHSTLAQQVAPYTAPAAFYARLIQIARNVGCTDIAVPEDGRQPRPADTSGHGAGMAYAASIAYLDGLTVANDGVQCLAVGLWGQGGCILTPLIQTYVNAAVAALG